MCACNMLALLCALYMSRLLTASNYDTQSKYIMRKAADDWYQQFAEALDENTDQEQIFRVWIRGLVYNYHQKFDKYMMEEMYIHAYRLLCNNSKIMKRMAVSPKAGLLNPFQKIYRWASSTRLKEIFQPLTANWDLSMWKMREQTTPILQNQETLRSLKDEFSKLILCNIDTTPSVYGTSKEYLRNLTNSKSSPTWTQIEIAITTFQLTMDILPMVKYHHLTVANTYLDNLGNIMAILTINSLKQAYRVVNIISDMVPELIEPFLDTRQKIIENVAMSNGTRRIEVDAAEMLIKELRGNADGNLMQQLLKANLIFQSCDTYFKTEADNNDDELSGSRYQFSIRLFKELMHYSKSLDVVYNGRYVINLRLLRSILKSMAQIIPISPEISVAMSAIFF
eukprot:511416_1